MTSQTLIKKLTASSRCLKVGPSCAAQPCNTRGGLSHSNAHSNEKTESRRMPVILFKSVQTLSPTSYRVRMVNSFKGSIISTSRKGIKTASVALSTSFQVADTRLVQRLSAAMIYCAIRGLLRRATPSDYDQPEHFKHIFWHVVPASETCQTYCASSGR